MIDNAERAEIRPEHLGDHATDDDVRAWLEYCERESVDPRVDGVEFERHLERALTTRENND